MHIESIALRTVLDSRARWTVQAVVNGVRANAPAGSSIGTHEACAFVPENLAAVEDDVRDALVGVDLSQEEIDAQLKEIDGSDDFSTLGSAAIAISLAAARAAGIDRGGMFPYPLGNVVGGGAHGGNTTIQEFLVLPSGAQTVPAALEINATIYNTMKERYARKLRGLNDESALILSMDDEEVLEALAPIVEEYNARISLDVAASECYESGEYVYDALDMRLSPNRHQTFLLKLIEEYNIAYVEDPFHEDDFAHFVALREKIRRKELDCMVVGDDLTVTQTDRTQRAINEGAIDAAIIKPNQAGTVTETRNTVDVCKENNVLPVMSHRSGETEDTTIVDLALAWNIPFLKAGIAGARVAKLNKLLHRWYDSSEKTMAEIP